jgi:DNA-3-methyladenine glycosylase I
VTGAAVGADGVSRCPWADSTDDYRRYHDTEWGVPVHGDVPLLERITLAFAGFDPAVIAGFGEPDVQRLMSDAGIVRNRRKIEATITNSRALLELHDAGRSLDELVWSFAPAPRARPATLAEVPGATPESAALSKALKSHGFVFVGPTTMYAAMQACGLVDDHLSDCHVPIR